MAGGLLKAAQAAPYLCRAVKMMMVIAIIYVRCQIKGNFTHNLYIMFLFEGFNICKRESPKSGGKLL